MGSTAARIADTQVQQLQEPQQLPRNELLTYYFDVSTPQISISTPKSDRAGRTAVTVTLSQAAVGTYMPVVSPKQGSSIPSNSTG